MRRMLRKAVRCVLFGMAVILTALPALAHACAVCAGGPEDNAYFWGVLFLMSMPFAVGGIVGGWLLYSYRRGLASLATAATPTVDRDMPRSSSTMRVSDGRGEASQADRA